MLNKELISYICENVNVQIRVILRLDKKFLSSVTLPCEQSLLRSS